ncbi:MAG: FHA domain-containing protein [Myxococcota bacterium]
MAPLPLSQLARRLIISPRPGSVPQAPALVWEAPPTALTESGHWELTDAGRTLTRPLAGEPVIFFVEKAVGTNNPFAMGVTIGRVESNDVVLEDGSVSRFHAWLQQDERTQQWAITDAESKNGTFLDGVQLAPRQRAPLADGARLKLGEVQLTFFLPESLKRFVEQRFREA